MNILREIQAHARVRGEQPALRGPAGTMTYSELEQQSNRLAAALQRGGFGSAPVMVYGHKDPWMVVCFLACVKSGRAYCPVDASVPHQRVQAIARCLHPSAVLAVEPLELEGVKALDPRQLCKTAGPEDCLPREESWVGPEDLFYLIFTSGSTGDPKGVQITTSCLEHYLDWSVTLGTAPEQKRGKVFLNQAPFSFDLSVMDLYSCLACGGTLWMLEKRVQADFSALFDSLGHSQAAVWVSTPSFADLCLSDPAFSQALLPHLELFLFCGETLANTTARRLLERFPKAAVVNTYGPTESTVAVTQVTITRQLAQGEQPLPVGRPKPGSWIEIYGEDGLPVPNGEKGEIVIFGDTVSTGYFGRPDLTQKAFFQTIRDGAPCRAYRTGDEGFLQDGMLFYSGRMDLQVKLHGYRIELGDIEGNLLRLPLVQGAAVVPREEDGRVKSLAAFVSLKQGTEGSFQLAQQLKRELRAYLPEYMIPKKFVFLDRIPMTPNGKADRKALKERLA